MLDTDTYTASAAEAQPECALFSPDELAAIHAPEPAAPETPQTSLTPAQVIASGLRAWAAKASQAKPVLRQIHVPDPTPVPAAPPKQPLFTDVNEYLAALRSSLPKQEQDVTTSVLKARFVVLIPGEDYRLIEEPLPLPTKLDRKRAIWRDLEERRAALEAKECRTEIENKILAALPERIEKAKAAWGIQANLGDTPQDRQRHEIDVWRAGDGREEYNASRRTVRQQANSDLSQLSPEEKQDRAAEQRYISNTRARLEKQGLPESEIEARIQAGLEKRRSRTT